VDQEKTREGSVAYRLARALETFVLRRADRIVVICEGLRRELAGRGLPPERIVVSPNGVDPAVFTPRDGKDPALLAQYRLEGRKVIGFIGSFFQFEGLECLLRAVPHLRRLDPAIHVVIVGGGDRERALRHEAQAAGLDGAVVFTGRVPHEQVAAYYSIMDALVYPRLSRRITELVTPLKPLEAMALQRPVIASDVGGLKELVRDGETGLLFKADDPEALARACARLVQDPALAQRLAAQGRAFVERERSWHAICARNVALYREMLPS
jgi:PEP-CTERM/exosortase A-associated glycosyltransferase